MKNTMNLPPFRRDTKALGKYDRCHGLPKENRLADYATYYLVDGFRSPCIRQQKNDREKSGSLFDFQRTIIDLWAADGILIQAGCNFKIASARRSKKMGRNPGNIQDQHDYRKQAQAHEQQQSTVKDETGRDGAGSRSRK